MSIKGDTFKELSKLIMSVEGTAWVDQYRGQFHDLENNYGIPFPAVLIQFAAGQWEDEGNGIQQGRSIVRIHVGYENYADAFEGSINQDQAIAYFDFMEELHTALQDSAGTWFSEMSRIAEGEDEPNGPLLRPWVDYECKLRDTSAYTARNSQVRETDPDVVVTKVDEVNGAPEAEGDGITFSVF